MPGLMTRSGAAESGAGKAPPVSAGVPPLRAGAAAGILFSRCANPNCATNWMRLWRSRRIPLFEGRWTCSPECMAEVVRWAVRREMGGGPLRESGMGAGHAHRIPLGLMLVEQGHISGDDLRTVLALRKRVAGNAEEMRLGQWLVESGVLTETVLTRTLGAQWSCPVFSLGAYLPESVASALPRLLSSATGALPVRAAGGRMLYVAFSRGIDRTLSYALQRILGMQVSAGIARDSEFVAAQARYLETAAPRTRFIEAASGAILARTVTKLIERERPVEARLVRVHEYYWLRMWKRPGGQERLSDCAGVEDVICMVTGGARGSC